MNSARQRISASAHGAAVAASGPTAFGHQRIAPTDTKRIPGNPMAASTPMTAIATIGERRTYARLRPTKIRRTYPKEPRRPAVRARFLHAFARNDSPQIQHSLLCGSIRNDRFSISHFVSTCYRPPGIFLTNAIVCLRNKNRDTWHCLFNRY